MTREEKHERILRINQTLRESGMDWEKIEKWWAKIFKEHKKQTT